MCTCNGPWKNWESVWKSRKLEDELRPFKQLDGWDRQEYREEFWGHETCHSHSNVWETRKK